MNIKRFSAYALLIFALAGLARGGSDIFRDIFREDGESVLSSGPLETEDTGDFFVYFFEGNTPCPVCDRIREMTKGIMGDPEGSIALFSIREVNVETPGNERYILDLELYSTSVVLAEESGGKIFRWKNLEEVWDLAGDPEGFSKYMTAEMDSFAKGEKP